MVIGYYCYKWAIALVMYIHISVRTVHHKYHYICRLTFFYLTAVFKLEQDSPVSFSSFSDGVRSCTINKVAIVSLIHAKKEPKRRFLAIFSSLVGLIGLKLHIDALRRVNQGKSKKCGGLLSQFVVEVSLLIAG